MRISKRVIDLVLSGGGTEEDKGLVASFFREHPEELVKYMTEESWDEFKPELSWDAPKEKMIWSIEEEIGASPVKRLRPKRSLTIWVAAAAAVLLAAPLLLLFKNKKITDKPRAIAVVSPEPKKPEWQTISNGSMRSKLCALPDGSTVKLGGNSRIRFASPAIDNRRDIYLEGEGTFTVAPDKARPFAVHSGSLTTTALGTVFRVNDKNGLITSVRLFSGRVVVKGRSFADVYLHPGQELRLNNNSLVVAIRRDEPKLPAVVKPQPIVMNFVKKPLTEIFNQLHQQYGITISYENVNLQNADFTGIFDSSKESFESFLTTLCDLNGLKLAGDKDKGYTIAMN